MVNRSITLTTAPPLAQLPRVQRFFRSYALPKSGDFPRTYYSNGIMRQNDRSCTIQYTLEGVGETWVSTKSFEVTPRHALINIANRVDTGYRYPEGHRGVWRFISFSLIGGEVRDLFRELIDRFGPVYDLSDSHEMLLSMAEQIERHGEAIYTAAESNAMYSRLISALLQSTERGRIGSDQMINAVHELVAKRVREPDSIRFGVAEVADQLGFSREYLSRWYHRAVGKTLKTYIDRKRMEYTIELLTIRNKSCSEAAHMIGMDHPANFTAYFRRMTGMTPTQFLASGSAWYPD